MSKVSSIQLSVIKPLVLSVVSSVAIVICNKYLISNLGFPFVTTLTSWHQVVTFCTLHIVQHLKFFEPATIDMATMLQFGVLNGSSIGLLNLSLGLNSVGFYQMTKLAIIPFIVLLETVFLEKKFSKNIKLSLSVLLVGFGIAAITDLKLNLLGSILSMLAIVTTCVSQILLYGSSPYQAAILFVAGPLVDRLLTKQNVFSYSYSFSVSAFIILSCSIAVVVNFSTFLVIGTTSPVTFQVLGHLKTCLILSLGYFVLHDSFTIRTITGILIAIFGMSLYSYFCVKEGKIVSANDALPVSQIPVKEATPFLLVQKSEGRQDELSDEAGRGYRS